MKKIVIAVVALILAFSTYRTVWADQSGHGTSGKHHRFQLGIDVLLKDKLDLIKGKNVGLITNPTGVNQDMVSDVDLLYNNPDVNLVALYGPEHGVRGGYQAGGYVPFHKDKETGLPVYSLYGPTRKPTPEMLKNVDVLIFDIQGVGTRFYTYISTMANAMQAAAENNIPFIVLDRPNPIGGMKVQGPVLDPAYSSFIGKYPIPMRPGMTMGELALFFNHEFSIGADLTVVKMRGWKRSMYYNETPLQFVMPSPNMPTPKTALVYPGLALIEGTNVSEGRGTTRPFELIGAPWIDAHDLADALNALDLPGTQFRAAHFTPTFSKHAGELVNGVQIHVMDRDAFNPIITGLSVVKTIHDMYPDDFSFRTGHFDLLMGNSWVREAIENGASVEDIHKRWQDDLQKWVQNVRNQYLLYNPYPPKAHPYKSEGVLGIQPFDLKAAPGQSVELTVTGFGADGNSLGITAKDVKWKIAGGVGQVENGVFTASSPGTGTLVASFNGLTAKRKVTVSPNYVQNIRYGVHSDYTRFVFDLNKTLDYNVSKNGDVLTVSVPYAEMNDQLNPQGGTVTISNSPVVSKITYGTENNQFVAHLQLKKSDVTYKTPTFSNRIVVDVYQ